MFWNICGAIIIIAALILVCIHVSEYGKYGETSNLFQVLFIIGAVIHLFVYWHTTQEEHRVIMTILLCILPFIITLVICDSVNDVKTDTGEFFLRLIPYLATHFLLKLIARSFASAFFSIIGFGLVGFIFYHFVAKPGEMDYEMSCGIYADDEKVKELYNQGVRPTSWYGSAESKEETKKELLKHGVNPYDDE